MDFDLIGKNMFFKRFNNIPFEGQDYGNVRGGNDTKTCRKCGKQIPSSKFGLHTVMCK